MQKTRTQTNTEPMFTSTPVGRRITENTKGNFGAPVKATDADGDLLTYSLDDTGNNNQNDNDDDDGNPRFGIDRDTGQLKVVGKLDFEAC